MCGICELPEKRKHQNGKVKNLAVDHDHVTGKIRGLLCADCNKGIGLLKDSVNLLLKACDFLNKNK